MCNPPFAGRHVSTAVNQSTSGRAATEKAEWGVLHSRSAYLSESRSRRGLMRVGATVEGLWTFLGEALDAFSPEECQNYFRHRDHPGAAR
jgi:hypothetical protein